MDVHVAPPETERPETDRHIPEAWSPLGVAEDSTLPDRGEAVLRLYLQDASGAGVLPLDHTAVYIPDLGFYLSDCEIVADDTDVISIVPRT